MAHRTFVLINDLPSAIAKFLTDSGYIGIQLTTDGPCVIRCDAISKSAFDKHSRNYDTDEDAEKALRIGVEK